MRAVCLFIATIAFALGGCTSESPDQPETDWVENAEWLQAEYSYDFLLNCWAEQWPDGNVKFGENAPPERLATQEDIDAAVEATRQNCPRELAARQIQIQVDLAKQGLVPPDLSHAADARLEQEIQDLFDEYWARL